MVRPASSPARSESSGTNAPSTNRMRRPSIEASAAPASLARALAAASGGGASGFASRMRARRSVYFHSSTRRFGSPAAAKRSNAVARSNAGPGSLSLAVTKLSARAVSAAVLIGSTSAFTTQRLRWRSRGPASRHLFLVLRVALGLELERQLLAAGAHDPPAREHVHDIRHDVIEQALIVRDDDEAALRRPQPIDALGHDLQRVDVEPGIGLVEHAEPRLAQRHLQHLVALLLSAGESHIDRAAQH